MGRRLAFDQAKGRLWVICTNCSRWNLSPLDERLEAIEACEKAYRDTRKRVATDQIGLAKVNDGLALVRIGTPVFPEYASWRYGERFARRRLKYWGMSAAGLAGGAIFVFGGPIALKAYLGVGGTGGALWLNVWNGLQKSAKQRRPLGLIRMGDRTSVVVKAKDADDARLVLGGKNEIRIDVEDGGKKAWYLSEPPKSVVRWSVTDNSAREFLRHALPHLNRKGGSEQEVSTAVETMQLGYDPVDPVTAANVILAKKDHQSTRLAELPQELRLGYEMAVVEAQERRWLEMELDLLSVAWKEAEDLANISDSLTLPTWIDDKLEALKGKR